MRKNLWRGRRYAENWFRMGDAWEAEQRRELVSEGAEAPCWLNFPSAVICDHFGGDPEIICDLLS